ncbi:Hsp20/alpha crystallin family protein [Paenibacillus sp. BSR1-1]|uniref:Hsp20/alpha crystallin family protein n=1 Tax=Paenibacillus sp. BSR1-1 TaxID=3020845 RepID=UPI0025AFC3E4|nr:Hsp20/alpha crystallin family protein [Paenibacillus sp. BSR1-1]MDN3019368.1 Hsp20/alpha crystallin family protein [Paenibacillus sp. BSR1-1]
MEVDKLKKWLDVAQQFQSEKFWNQIFNENNRPSSLNPVSAVNEFFPKCDLYETENELIVEAEIPGLDRDSLQISVQQQVLAIKGEFKAFQQNRKYYLKERASRSFKKELLLPYPIFVHKIKSELRNGVLTLSMPMNREEVEDIPITFEQSNPE